MRIRSRGSPGQAGGSLTSPSRCGRVTPRRDYRKSRGLEYKRAGAVVRGGADGPAVCGRNRRFGHGTHPWGRRGPAEVLRPAPSSAVTRSRRSRAGAAWASSTAPRRQAEPHRRAQADRRGPDGGPRLPRPVHPRVAHRRELEHPNVLPIYQRRRRRRPPVHRHALRGGREPGGAIAERGKSRPGRPPGDRRPRRRRPRRRPCPPPRAPRREARQHPDRRPRRRGARLPLRLRAHARRRRRPRRRGLGGDARLPRAGADPGRAPRRAHRRVRPGLRALPRPDGRPPFAGDDEQAAARRPPAPAPAGPLRVAPACPRAGRRRAARAMAKRPGGPLRDGRRAGPRGPGGALRRRAPARRRTVRRRNRSPPGSRHRTCCRW